MRLQKPRDPSARPVPLYIASFLALGMSVSFVGPALGDLQARAGVGIEQIANLFFVQSLGFIVGAQLGGRLYDRFAGHRVFGVGLLIAALGFLAVPSQSSLTALEIVFFIIGFGTSMADLGGNVMMLWALGPRAGRAMNIMHTCFGIGALGAPVLVYFGVGVAATVAAVACVASATWAQTLPSPRPAAAHSDGGGEVAIAKLVLVGVFFALYVGVEVGFAGWIHTYASEVGFTALGATWVTSLFWVGFIASRIASVVIGDRFTPRSMLIWSASVTVLAALVFVAGRSHPAAVWVASVSMGVATAPQFPAMLVYVERRIDVTGAATAVFLVGAGIGGLLFPWMMGQGFGLWGPNAVAYALVLLAIGLLSILVAVERALGPARLVPEAVPVIAPLD